MTLGAVIPIESGKNPLRSSIPTVPAAPSPRPPLNRVPRCHIYRACKSLQSPPGCPLRSGSCAEPHNPPWAAFSQGWAPFQLLQPLLIWLTLQLCCPSLNNLFLILKQDTDWQGSQGLWVGEHSRNTLGSRFQSLSWPQNCQIFRGLLLSKMLLHPCKIRVMNSKKQACQQWSFPAHS